MSEGDRRRLPPGVVATLAAGWLVGVPPAVAVLAPAASAWGTPTRQAAVLGATAVLVLFGLLGARTAGR